jgi:uncharacterized membrane protein YiaA
MEHQVTYNTEKKEVKKPEAFTGKPTAPFIAASWTALLIGMVSYCVGVGRSEMLLNERGYYFVILLFGLFSVISVQKAVRDKQEGVAVTDMYYGISWFVTIASIVLLVIGLWNADLWPSEKGFYGMSFLLSLFAAIAVQKNTRDVAFINENWK